jgi:hypothetical protein
MDARKRDQPAMTKPVASNGDTVMKRFVIVTALLLGGIASAQADTDTWARNSRGGPTLHTAMHYCSETAGPNRNGMRTPLAYKRCMARIGWRYVRTTIDYRHHSHGPFGGWYNS